MPKNSLENHITPTGWKITKKLSDPLGSGGFFCARYEATSSDGKVAFLKAMDLSSAMGNLNRLKEVVDECVFEQEILKYCKDQKMTKVVSPIDVGTIYNNNFPAPMNAVYYIIFDMAEGDLRKSHLEVVDPSRQWLPAFTALHHTVIGVNQLHKAEIAHQDIKPSNVLAYNEKLFKISDLGRVVDKKGASPFSQSHFPGDYGYRPIEMCYGQSSSDFTARLACDMFMLGSLIYHLIEDTQINVVIMEESKKLHAAINLLDYPTALPFIITTFYAKLEQFKEKCHLKFGPKIGQTLYVLVKEMCHPDPLERGEIKYKSDAARFSLERYVGLLGQVVLRAKIEGIQ